MGNKSKQGKKKATEYECPVCGIRWTSGDIPGPTCPFCEQERKKSDAQEQLPSLR